MIRSVLRIRPSTKKETQNQCLVEHVEGGTIVVHPRTLLSPKNTGQAIDLQSDQEFNVDQVLHAASQDQVYFSIGHAMAQDAMSVFKRGEVAPNHLLIGVGHALSGKSYTLTETSRKKCDSDGLVPRMVDSLFSQAHHHVQSNDFRVEITCVQMADDDFIDLNAASNRKFLQALSPNKSFSHDQMVQLPLGPVTKKLCTNAGDARLVLQAALQRRRQGHVYIEIQSCAGSKKGGMICVLDMESHSQVPVTKRPGEVVTASDASTALWQCLSAVRDYQLTVPYTQHSVTKLLQPLLQQRPQVTLLGTTHSRDDPSAWLHAMCQVRRLDPKHQVNLGLVKMTTVKKTFSGIKSDGAKSHYNRPVDEPSQHSRSTVHHENVIRTVGSQTSSSIHSGSSLYSRPHISVQQTASGECVEASRKLVPSQAVQVLYRKQEAPTISMSYSSGDDAVFEPLPPPVAPGYHDDAATTSSDADSLFENIDPSVSGDRSDNKYKELQDRIRQLEAENRALRKENESLQWKNPFGLFGRNGQ